jgi:hypothetical protein
MRVSLEDYQRVESSYLSVAIAFLPEAGIQSLQVRDLENAGATPVTYGAVASDLQRRR